MQKIVMNEATGRWFDLDTCNNLGSHGITAENVGFMGLMKKPMILTLYRTESGSFVLHRVIEGYKTLPINWGRDWWTLSREDALGWLVKNNLEIPPEFQDEFNSLQM